MTIMPFKYFVWVAAFVYPNSRTFVDDCRNVSPAMRNNGNALNNKCGTRVFV